MAKGKKRLLSELDIEEIDDKALRSVARTRSGQKTAPKVRGEEQRYRTLLPDANVHAVDKTRRCFYDLPPELSNRILDDALSAEQVLLPSQNGILRSCKFIREQMMPMAYNSNVFLPVMLHVDYPRRSPTERWMRDHLSLSPSSAAYSHTSQFNFVRRSSQHFGV